MTGPLPTTPADPAVPATALRLPSLDGLRAFEAVARLGSLERAADELAITASAVGKRLATLEETLDLPLFFRGQRQPVLTPAGADYLPQVRAALALLAAIPQHRRGADRPRRLRVSVPPTFGRQVLVPALHDFSARHPGIELELLISIPYLDTAAPDADLTVRAGVPAAGCRVLMDDVLTPVAAPALAARLPHPARAQDLAAVPLLRTPVEPWTPWLRAAGLDWPEPAEGHCFVDLGLVLEAAASGQGVALARPSLAWPWLREGSLRPLFGLSVPAQRPYHLLPHADDPAVRAFADWLAETAGAHARTAAERLSALR